MCREAARDRHFSFSSGHFFEEIRHRRSRSFTMGNVASSPPRRVGSNTCKYNPGGGPVSRTEGPFAGGVSVNYSLPLHSLEKLYKRYRRELLALREPARHLCASLRAQAISFCSSDDIE